MPEITQRTAESCYRALMAHPEGRMEQIEIPQYKGTPAVMIAQRAGRAIAIWLTALNAIDTDLMEELRNLFRIPEDYEWSVHRLGASQPAWMQVSIVWELL